MFAASKTAGVTGGVNYIEDVFSTWLYTGTGATQTITNSIDTTTYGGLVWIKGRSGATGHRLTDTVRGVTKSLASETTAAQATEATGLTAFGTTGFTIGADADYNTSAATYVGWTFREQPKFFDVVTYTGTGSNRTISHNLGSAPGFMIVKCTSTTANWATYHRSLSGANYYMELNGVGVEQNDSTVWNATAPTSTVFSVGTSGLTNSNGQTYVAYLFAHNAGGFGLTGTDNVITCGSYTGNGSSQTITLGYEPQWLMIKRVDDVSPWRMHDVMRGMSITANLYLEADTSSAEASYLIVNPTATGFTLQSGPPYYNASGGTYIYIAIRRGPMKVPTTGTSVFSPVLGGSSGFDVAKTTGFPIDMQLYNNRGATALNSTFSDRLRGVSTTSNNTTDYYSQLRSSSTASQTTNTLILTNGWSNTGFRIPIDETTQNGIYYNFLRAPSFFDEVCYTGTGANTTQTHNLKVVPELIICKRRDSTGAWDSYSSALANTEYIVLNTTAAKATGATRWNSTTPTSSVFSLGTSTTVNASAGTYVAYLFATCAGVSKVGSYTGNGTTQTIDCGITAGARFVLIKRTDSTGDWYVYDTARGMTTLTDPYLLLNTTAAETATLGSVTTVATGFALNSTILAAINVNAGTYIFLAIA
jgi:hypothetical protein